MKTFFKYATCFLSTIGILSCGNLYEIHEEYLKMGEEIYVGKADSLEANGGFNRVELRWQLNADPKISTCEISWNGCENPVIVEADRTQKEMSKIIDLPEGNYIFSIIVNSESGKHSLTQTISGTSYGENYQNSLPQRGISSVNTSPNGATINWIPEEGCVGVNIEYTNNKGQKCLIKVNEKEEKTFIADFMPGSEYVITSLYKPELNSIDEIPSLPTVYHFPTYYIISKEEWENDYHLKYKDLERTGWTIEANTEEAGGEGPVNGYVNAILDGDLNTFWHSKWSDNANPILPHVITIDMKEIKVINSIELARRANNKDTKKVNFNISKNGKDWTELGELTFPNSPNPNSKILLLPKSINGRYIKINVTESNNKPHASIAEILFTTNK